MADDGYNRLKDCRHGRMLYNVNDRFLGRSLDLYGEWSEGEIDLFKQFVGPGDVVIEAGANIGAHTVWLAKASAPGGMVLAFEPQRLIFQTLCANLALNSVTNVVAFPSACGESRGIIFVPMLDPFKSNNFGALEVGTHTEVAGENVAVMRLDDLAVSRCRLLKVDVEGMELEVLKGARETISRCKPVLYVENDRKEKSAALVGFIESLGYQSYWHRPPMFNPDNFAGSAENVFHNMVSFNMICVPPGASVVEMRTLNEPVSRPT